MQEGKKMWEETTKAEERRLLRNWDWIFCIFTGIVIDAHEQKYDFAHAKQVDELLQE